VFGSTFSLGLPTSVNLWPLLPITAVRSLIKKMMLLRSMVLLAVMAICASAEGAPKKITQSEALNAAVSKVQPEYPALAKQLKISGAVELDVMIGENGSVESVTPISGNPVLTKPAADALKKWKFKPFSQDGNPVKAQAAMKISFSN
jgi:TonB family protein